MRSELDPENETVGQGGALPRESADARARDMKGKRKKYNAGPKDEGGAGSDQGRADDRRAGERVRGPSEPDLYNWKKQLLHCAASVFEGGNTTAEGAAQVDLLYRQIGHWAAWLATQGPARISGAMAAARNDMRETIPGDAPADCA
jgi:hypothetical protein